MGKRTYEDLKKRLQEVPGYSEYDAWFDEVCKRIEDVGVPEQEAFDIALSVLASGDMEDLKTITVNTRSGRVDLDVATVFYREGF